MPLLSSFSTAAANAYGFAYALVTQITENFDRSLANLNNQKTSDNKSIWKVIRGSWATNGTQATSSDTNYSTALVGLGSNNIANAQVDIPDGSGGVGLAFWASDAGSMWAAYTSYSYTTSSSQTCSATYVIDTLSSCTNWSGRCGSCNATTYYQCSCLDGGSCEKTTTWTSTQCNNCCGSGNVAGYNNQLTWYQFLAYQTISTSTYYSQFKIDYYNGSAWSNQHTNTYNQNTSGTYSKGYSIAINTSGNTIYYNVYSAISKGGSVLTSSSYISSGNIGSKAGIVKTTSAVSQGSILDNFSITTN